MKDSLKKHPTTVAVLTAIVLAAGAAYYYAYQILPPEQVRITMSYSPDTPCRVDSPLYMLIVNDSLRDVISTSFTLTVKRAIDNNFIQFLEKDYSTDRIIKAGESYAGCWVYPELNTKHYVPEELIYEIKHQQIVFMN